MITQDGSSAEKGSVAVKLNNHMTWYVGGRVDDDKWHHVVLTINSTSSGTNATIYIDGEQNATFFNATETNITIDDDDKFSIGQEYDGGLSEGDYFYGKIDDVAIFDRVLTQDEIRNLYLGRRIDINHVPWPINAVMPWK